MVPSSKDPRLAHWNAPKLEDQHRLIAGQVPWDSSQGYAEQDLENIVPGKVRSYLGSLKEPVIVEIGCGIGRLLRAWKRKDGDRLIGLDLAPNMIERAREYCADLPRLELAVTDGEIPLADGEAAFVYAYLVFQHLSQKEIREYLAEAIRVLRPGGFLRVQTFKGEPFDPKKGYGGMHGNWYPDLPAFEAEVEAAGFEVVDGQQGLGYPLWLWVTGKKPRSWK